MEQTLPILTVGPGLQYATLAAAIAAAHSGDTINVQAGTYHNDFPQTITTNIRINGVGGLARFVATKLIPNDKGILVTNANVSIDHLEFTGAAVTDDNGSGIRYEGGSLTVTNSWFHDNQNGILANSDTNGLISIDHSEFDHNGTGDGQTHNIYISSIKSFSFTNSYSHDANEGHELKSRAATNIIAGDRIDDGTGTASLNIDLPDGGADTIQNNVIRQGVNSDNGNMIAFGEETSWNRRPDAPLPNSSLQIEGNTIINDIPRTGTPNHTASGYALGIWNTSPMPASISGNHFYGLTSAKIASGPNAQSNNNALSSEPIVDRSHPWTGSASDNVASGASREFVPNGKVAVALIENHYFLQDSTGAGPEVIRQSGNPATAGEFGAGNAIAAVKTETGYEVFWQNTASSGPPNTFNIWSANSNGNWTRTLAQNVSGSDPMIAAAESLFQQDLNGDGHIPPPPLLASTTPRAAAPPQRKTFGNR